MLELWRGGAGPSFPPPTAGDQDLECSAAKTGQVPRMLVSVPGARPISHSATLPRTLGDRVSRSYPHVIYSYIGTIPAKPEIPSRYYDVPDSKGRARATGPGHTAERGVGYTQVIRPVTRTHTESSAYVRIDLIAHTVIVYLLASVADLIFKFQQLHVHVVLVFRHPVGGDKPRRPAGGPRSCGSLAQVGIGSFEVTEEPR